MRKRVCCLVLFSSWVGLLDVTTDARGEVGRPQHRYSLAADAPSLGLEPPTMPMLARMVLAMAQRLGASPADADGRRRGRRARRAARYDDAPSALEALVADLDRLGFDPLVTEGDAAAETDADAVVTAVVAFANCPFADLARDHPDLVWACTGAWWPGSSPRWATPRSTEFCPLDHRTPCQVSVASDSVEIATPPRRNPVITLTDSAAVKVKELLAAEGADDLALRVAVRPGGCSGFSYEMFFDGDIAADDEQASFGPTAWSRSSSTRPPAQLLDRRHARLQGRPRAVRVRHHEPERQPHLRLRPELLLISFHLDGAPVEVDDDAPARGPARPPRRARRPRTGAAPGPVRVLHGLGRRPAASRA